MDRSAPGPGRTPPRRCTHQLTRRNRPSSSLYLFDLLVAKVRAFNPSYTESPGDLIRRLRQLHATIHGNRDFVELLRNHGRFFDQGEKSKLDLILIDYNDTPNRRFP